MYPIFYVYTRFIFFLYLCLKLLLFFNGVNKCANAKKQSRRMLWQLDILGDYTRIISSYTLNPIFTCFTKLQFKLKNLKKSCFPTESFWGLQGQKSWFPVIFSHSLIIQRSCNFSQLRLINKYENIFKFSTS